MNNNKKNYEETLLTYLEQKYDEKFVIESMKRQVNVDKPDVILAQCHSEKYENESFDLNYHLSLNDIYKKDEVIALIKESGAYDESKLKTWEEEIEPYIEDNYTNVIKQHQFDEEFILPAGVTMITKFETLEYYPTLEESKLGLTEYIANDSHIISAHHCVIAPTSFIGKELSIIECIKHSKIKYQYITIFYTDAEKEKYEDIYYKNYKFPEEAIEQDGDIEKKELYAFKYGEVRN